MEKLKYDTPVAVAAPVAELAFAGLELSRDLIRVQLQDDSGRLSDHYYRGADAAVLFKQINNGDFSSVTLEHWLMARLATDAKVAAGSKIEGTPDK